MFQTPCLFSSRDSRDQHLCNQLHIFLSPRQPGRIRDTNGVKPDDRKAASTVTHKNNATYIQSVFAIATHTDVSNF